MRVPAAVVGWVAAAVMCLAGAWGFFDHIAIALFHIPPTTACAAGSKQTCRTSPGEKVARVGEALASDAFIVARQASLDVRTLPRVVAGTKYNAYLTSAAWNTWVREGGWEAHFPAEQVAGLLAPEARPDDPHLPAVAVPGGGEARGLLIKDADLVFPLGLFLIALRFLLRSVLALSGHVRVDPDSAHREEDEHEDGLRGDDRPPHAISTGEG